MKLKLFAVLAFLLATIPAFGQGVGADRVVLNNNASLEQTYVATATIANGQLVKVTNSSTLINGIAYANVIPLTTSDTSGILGVADGNATSGGFINVRIQGQGFVLTDGGCAIGNSLVPSQTVGGSATCVTVPGSFQSAGFSLGALGSAGLVSGAINAGGGGGGSGGTPGAPIGCVQFNISSAFQTGLAPICEDSPSLPTTLTIPLNLTVSGDLNIGGPDYAIDVRASGARSASIHTTGTGSGTSLTVGSASFRNNDGIAIAGGGASPSISAPTGLAVTPGTSEGETTADVPIASGFTGASTYNYCLFGVDILGGATTCSSTTTITNGAAALGKQAFTISTWNLTGNTLQFVTSVSSGLPIGTLIHTTGTSNNALAEGWFPISNISGATITVNNVPQYAVNTSGTSGSLVAFAGNKLTWTASSGGLGLTFPWEYYVCAQRPGDGSFHIIGQSFPSTLYHTGDQFIALQFDDFGSTLSSNPVIPWYLSDANCTNVSSQGELAVTTVKTGGGTTGLTLNSALTNSVTSAPVRFDNQLAFSTALSFASSQHATLYIPANQTFEINSLLQVPLDTNIWQSGRLQLNNTMVITASNNWFGTTGAENATQFAFNQAPKVSCTINPCVYVGGLSSSSQGANTFTNVEFDGPSNGNSLLFLVDQSWGTIWDKVNLVTGASNNDNMGIALMIRPGAANYKIRNSTFSGGPNQITDQSWAPLVYLAPAPATGCCSGGGTAGPTDFDNNMFNRRGIYLLAYSGTDEQINIHGLYRQGGITPMLMQQNQNGNVDGNTQMDFVVHDTENEAAYAWICGPGCAAGFSNVSGIAFHLGNASTLSQDAGSSPPQITGGGNSAIRNLIAAVGAGGVANVPEIGFMVSQGAIFPMANINMNGGPFGYSTSIVPNVPTPMLTLEGGSFNSNMSGVFTATRTITVPDASGTLCLTTTCGGQFYQTLLANGTPETQEPKFNFINGTNMTISCVDNGGSTRTDCTFTSSATAATAFSAITAAANSNAGTFSASGNTWDFSAAAAFKLPTVGAVFPGSSSGAITVVAPATTAIWSLTLPPNAGAVGQYLTTDGTGISTWAQINFTQLQGSVACNQMPALTGDSVSTAGFCTTTNIKVNGVSYPANPATNTVPVVTAPNTVTYQSFPSTALFQTNGSSNATQTGLNFLTSTTNTDGLIITPTNASGGVTEKFELTGTLLPIGSGCGISSPAAHSISVWEGSSTCILLGSPTLNGLYYPAWNVVSNAAVDPAVFQVGLPPRSIIGAATTDTFTAADVGKIVSHDVAGAASVTETLPTATTLNNPNYQATYCNRSNQTDSIVPTTWTIQNGNNAGTSTLSIPSGVCVRITVDANSATQWHADEYGVGTVTGDGAMYNNFGSTGSVVLSLANAAADTLWGNSTGSPATPAYFRPTAHFLQLTLTCSDVSGSGTAQSCSTTPTFTPAAGDTIIYKTTTTNTGDLTINVNASSAAHARKWAGSSTLIAGDLPLGIPELATFDGTFWEFYTIGNAPAGGGGTAFSALTGGTNSGAAMTIGTGASLTVSGSGTNNATSVNGNTFPASGALNSGGIPFASSASAFGISLALTANSPVLGGGAGTAPKTIAGITSDGVSVLTLGVAGTSVGKLALNNATSGSITLAPPTGALGAVTVTIPDATDTLVNLASSQALTNKTYDGLTHTALATGFSIAGGTSSKTLTLSNTMTLVGTDSSTYTFPGASATMTFTVASGTATLGTSAIASGACATVVTVSATGVLSSDRMTVNPNQSIKAVTGYIPITTGGLSIGWYPTAGNVNFDVCNWSTSSITPGSITLNWGVTR